MDVELCLTKQSLPFLVRLIGQSVFPYSLQLSLFLPEVSNQKPSFLGCLDIWEAEFLTVLIVMRELALTIVILTYSREVTNFLGLVRLPGRGLLHAIPPY